VGREGRGVSSRWTLAWAAAAALWCGWAFVAPRDVDSEPAELGPVRRLLGPFAGLGAEVEWILFTRANAQGDAARAIEHAETAIELDPASPRGYELLALHLALDRGSARVEADPARRLAWIEAGLAVAARGEARSTDPAALAFLQGYILQVRAESDVEIEWPGGPDAPWRAAEAHFARAAELGDANAARGRDYARERAAEAR